MKSFLAVLCLVICSAFSGQLFAQQSCPTLSSVKKWEVISHDKILAYDNNDQYYFFLNFTCIGCAGKAGGPITLRFFSSTICKWDSVMVNGIDTKVKSIEVIRR